MLAKRMDPILQASRGDLNCEGYMPEPNSQLLPGVKKHPAQKVSTPGVAGLRGVFWRSAHVDKKTNPYGTLRPRAPGTSKKDRREIDGAGFRQ